MKLLFENWRKFINESAFSGNGPLSEPIEEIDETLERPVNEDYVDMIRKVMAKDGLTEFEVDKDKNIDDIQYYINILSKKPYKIEVTPREVVYAAEQLGLVEDVRDFVEPDPNEEPWEGGPGSTMQPQRDPDDPMWSRGWYEDDYGD